MAVRITIELTEEESRSATVDRQIVPGSSEQDKQSRGVETSDGGAPSEELLASVGRGGSAGGSQSGATGETGSGPMNGGSPTDAGEPAGWMSLEVRGPDG